MSHDDPRRNPYSKADADITDPRHQRKVKLFLLALTLPWLVALAMLWFTR